MTDQLHNFDTEWDAAPQRGFVARGRRFVVRSTVKPEKLEPWAKFEPSQAKDDPLASLRMIDKLMEDLLATESVEAWHELRTVDGDGELGVSQILEIVKYVTELVAGRPTSAPSPSGIGGADPATGTPSTADSPPQGLISVPST